MRLINRRFPLIVLAGLALPALAGWAISGTLAGAATGFLWGGLVRVFLVHHVTWSVNSVCHFLGTRRFETDDESRNVFWLALPSFGESWHHNHHAFPRSAEHGLRRWELDPSALVISGLERGRAWRATWCGSGRSASSSARRERLQLASLALHHGQPRAHALRLVALERAEDHVAARAAQPHPQRVALARADLRHRGEHAARRGCGRPGRGRPRRSCARSGARRPVGHARPVERHAPLALAHAHGGRARRRAERDGGRHGQPSARATSEERARLTAPATTRPSRRAFGITEAASVPRCCSSRLE